MSIDNAAWILWSEAERRLSTGGGGCWTPIQNDKGGVGRP